MAEHGVDLFGVGRGHFATEITVCVKPLYELWHFTTGVTGS